MHPILSVPGKVYTHGVYRCAEIDVVYVNESNTRDRRLERKYEPRHEINGLMTYANKKRHNLCICAPLLFAV